MSEEVITGELQAEASASADIDDDPIKKKKFKPFQKMKNFFRGGSKKRFKPEEIGGKSHSIGALHNKNVTEDDDDDEGGFSSRLAGSRSISEDSVFKPELKENPIPMLKGQAVSMENIDTNPAAQSLSKPQSYQQSDQSIRSMDTSDEEHVSGSMRPRKRETSSSLDSLDGIEDVDLDSVLRSSSALNNEAAKHRIAVKPKSRRISSKMSMKRLDRSAGSGHLADVKEESPEKTAKSTDVAQKPVISTTIPIGDSPDAGVTVMPVADAKPRNAFSSSISPSNTSRDINKAFKSDLSKSMYGSTTPAQDIPVGSMSGDEGERVRPRSISPLSPLSTSPPVSTAMLQEVKLRSRSSLKKPSDDNVPKESSDTNELAKAFKRRSRKFDEITVAELEKQTSTPKPQTEVKPVENVKVVKDIKDVKVDSEVKVEKKPVEVRVAEKKNAEVKIEKKVSDVNVKPEVSKLSDTVKNEDIKDKPIPANPTPTSPTGVSFVLKKEPLRPQSKVNVTTVTSFGQNVETSSIVEVDNKGDTQSNVKVESDSEKFKDTKSASIDSQSASPSNKLASPREEYRLKRQVRSKTLPVSKEAMEKAEEKVQASSNRNSADYENISILRSTAKAADIETARNVSVAEKRASWAHASASSGTDTRPEWIIRPQNKEKKTEEDKNNKPKEIKIEPNKDVKPIAKPSDASPTDKASDTTTTSIPSTRPSIKSDKPVIGAPKPSVDTNSFSITAARSQFVKSTPVTAAASKPTTSESSKPAVNTATKPAVGSISKLSSTFNKEQDTPKPLTSAFKKPAVLTAPSVQVDKQNSAKPFVNKSPQKQVIQSVKPPVVGGSVNKFGSSKHVDTPRLGLVKQTSLENLKPAPLGVRPAGVNNKVNVAPKADTKELTKDVKETPKIQTNIVNKPMATQGNNENSQQTNTSTSANRSGSLYGSKPVSSNIGDSSRKFGSNVGSKKNPEMKIEIIDKDKSTVAKPEQKPAAVQMREKPKTAPEKCSDSANNRPSKVLDMVKSFQKLQAT